ncbi:MAG: thiamine phosphate synthase, partial [Polyangiaceae bacterium]
GCDGVHVGQHDMDIHRVRRIAPGLGVGVSTHTLEQMDAALAARPDYVAFGPVFETSTKMDAESVVGVAGLTTAYAHAHAAGIPLVAIGGVTRERARALVGAADVVAAIAELLPARVVLDQAPRKAEWQDEVAGRARRLNELFAAPPTSVPTCVGV